MSARTSQWLLSSTCVAALLLTVDNVTAGPLVQHGKYLPDNWEVIASGHGMQLVLPPSSQAKPAHHFRTFLRVVVPKGGYDQFRRITTAGSPPETGWLAETPASLACVYQLGVGGKNVGCNPNSVTKVVTGGSQNIAVVDAYDYGAAAAASDLSTFSTQFGLSAANLTVIYGTGNPNSGCTNGSQPASSAGTGWDVEEALDMDAAHALAPSAHIYLVEANSSSITDLENAVKVATACVTQSSGHGQQSHSFGYLEAGYPCGSSCLGRPPIGSATEHSFDAAFSTTAHVTYLVSAGDDLATFYPCTSPNVFCVGGTSILRNPTTGAFESESTWNTGPTGATGGGSSLFEARPAFQSGAPGGNVSAIVGSTRGTPDLAAAADPYAGGMWIYNTSSCSGWCVVGGTSEASPLLAGLLNFAGIFFGTTPGGLANIYSEGVSGELTGSVTNVNSGSCGQSPTYFFSFEGVDPQNTKAVTGIPYNMCSGWGVPEDAGNPHFKELSDR